jgi:hypothetical protein
MSELGIFGIFVVGGSLVSGLLWTAVIYFLPRPVRSVSHSVVIHLTALSIILVDAVVLLSVLGQPPSVLRLVFGLAVGFQLVAALAAILFLREVSRE